VVFGDFRRRGSSFGRLFPIAAVLLSPGSGSEAFLSEDTTGRHFEQFSHLFHASRDGHRVLEDRYPVLIPSAKRLLHKSSEAVFYSEGAVDLLCREQSEFPMPVRAPQPPLDISSCSLRCDPSPGGELLTRLDADLFFSVSPCILTQFPIGLLEAFPS